ncbi:MAG: TetR/AcrR family transcriptional regulator, partial [Chloroflexota bacterium]|nr:TetR/AcrR family transcriptional regulator [Chloroflexota bacterium]
TTRARRARSPQGEGGRLRDELVRAADRLLERTGDEAGLTLRAVAREAGIAAPSVYLHFAGRDELVRAVLDRHFAGFREALQTGIAAAGDDPAAQLRAGCLAYCRFGLTHPGPYRVMFGNRTAYVPTGNFDEVPGADTFGSLVDGVAGVIAAGLAPPGDPLRLATGVWTALHGIVTLRAAVPMFPWPPVEDLIEDILVGLVGIPPRPPSVPTETDGDSAPGTD